MNDENRGLITGKLFRKIKPGALFVNTARAGVVVEEDMMCELRTGRFTAVLDVFHEEPLPVESELRIMSNVISPYGRTNF